MAATVVTYSGPTGISASSIYTVDVFDGTNHHNSFVYQTVGEDTCSPGYLDISYTNFEMSDGPVTVTVTDLSASLIESCTIRPKRYHISPEYHANNTVSFTLETPRKVEVDIAGNRCSTGTKALFIFANPPAEPVPTPSGTGILHEYSAPNVYDIGKLTLGAGDAVYIHGGAYVRGSIDNDGAGNVKIAGYGVLSGENEIFNVDPNPGYGHYVLALPQDSSCKDLTIVNNCGIFTYSTQQNSTTDNVKILVGHLPPPDHGVLTGGTGGLVAYSLSNDYPTIINNCFIQAGDDTYCLSFASSGTIVTNCTAYTTHGGSFQCGWNGTKDVSNITVQCCDVIRSYDSIYECTAPITSNSLGSEVDQHDILYDDIIIENGGDNIDNTHYLANFSICETEWGHTPYGWMDNITLRNITCEAVPNSKSIISGYDSTHMISNVTFDNVKINGVTLDESNYTDYINVDPNTTYNIRFGNYTLPEPRPNILLNPDFENGTDNWSSFGSTSTFGIDTTNFYSGTQSLHVITSAVNSGAQQDITSLLTNNGQGLYEFRAMVYVPSEIPAQLNIGLQITTGSCTTTKTADTSVIGGWVQIYWTYDISWDSLALAKLTIKCTGDSATNEFYLDSCYMKKLLTPITTASPTPTPSDS